jgi:ribosomal protein S27E
LQQYEQQVAERRQPGQAEDSSEGAAIEVQCEDCRQKSSFPSSQKGTVQDCPHCGAYVDVGPSDNADPFWLEGDDTVEE